MTRRGKLVGDFELMADGGWMVQLGQTFVPNTDCEWQDGEGNCRSPRLMAQFTGMAACSFEACPTLRHQWMRRDQNIPNV